MQKQFNDANAGLITAMQETEEENIAIMKAYRKKMKNSLLISVGIFMAFIAIHDFDRWPQWSTYLAAIMISGCIAGIICLVYWLWKKPKVDEPEKKKLNQLAKVFMMEKVFPALWEKPKHDGYAVDLTVDMVDLLNEGEFVKKDRTLIDGKTYDNEQIWLTKGGIKFVLSKWSFNETDFDVEARILTEAIKI